MKVPCWLPTAVAGVVGLAFGILLGERGCKAEPALPGWTAFRTAQADRFPSPVSVKDTSVRFWWVERATFGQKLNDVTSVVVREPKSGRAIALHYQTPGPVLSFVVDTVPQPKILFGTFATSTKKRGTIAVIVGTIRRITGCEDNGGQ